jgi:hypothetical protein
VTTSASSQRPLVAVLPDFLASALRRSGWALWGAALAAAGLLEAARGIGSSFNVPSITSMDSLGFSSPEAFVPRVVCEAACIAIAILVGDEAVARGSRPGMSYGLAVALGCLGVPAEPWLLALALSGGSTFALPFAEFVDDIASTATMYFEALVVCGLCTFVFVDTRSARHASLRRRSAELARAQAARHAQESRLQAMQARVEPQFLFDTLAQVHRMHEADPKTAGDMLEDLTTYFRATLPQLRESASTVGREIALARAYLSIMRMRLQEDLMIRVELPAEASGARLPSMLLLPIVEQSLTACVRTGTGPRTITLAATASGGRLGLTVADTHGTPLPPSTRAMQAVHDRLRSLHGTAACLRLEPLAPRGTLIVLEMPHEEA